MLALVVACAALAFVVPLRQAAAQPIAPLIPRLDPPQDPAIVARFHEALAAGLRAAKLPALSARQVLRAAEARTACASAECAAQAQRALFVERAATARIAVVGRNYTMAIDLYRGPQREGSERGSCDVCTLAEAITATSALAERVAEAAGPLGSAGAAAAAVEPAPSAPADVAAAAPTAPSATTAAQAPGPGAAPRTGRADAPAPRASESGAPLTAKAPARWPLWPALAATGMAAVGLAIGLPLLAIDGKGTDCRGPARPDYRNCERLYATSGGGWVMTTLGLASLASAAALLYLYLAPRRQPAVSSAPTALGLLEHLRLAPVRGSLTGSRTGGLLVGGGGVF
ncbi:MAG: hypothetical protein IPL40_08840 [Proteobacteria bacterium]|nr:hypothetical protein [Pseudomonadota bacterium]